jgi:F0F1-type ATP synthase alpha subunit
VNEPLQTGIKAIDSMTPIGRGQRELIIGDRKTGKTAIAIDTIINQKGRTSSASTSPSAEGIDGGRRSSSAASTSLRTARWTTPSSSSPRRPTPPRCSTSPPTPAARWPSTSCTKGRDTLCVYDDLTKQAAAYRQLSLLLRRPPGREAYPGDVFYCHSRLLERSAKLADRGKRMVELLKQPQFQPYETFEQVAAIFAGTKGVLDELALADVLPFEADMLKHLRNEHPEILDEMRATGDLPDALAATLLEVLTNFRNAWLAEKKKRQEAA